MSATIPYFDIDNNIEEVFWLYNRKRSHGSNYNFHSKFQGIHHGQTHFSHAVPLKIMLTNDFYNIRNDNNGFRLIVVNETDSTSTIVDVKVAAGRYDTITSFLTALETALSTPVNDAVDALESGATATVAVTKTSDNFCQIAITVSGNSDTFGMNFEKSPTAFSSTYANDVERMIGFVSNDDTFPADSDFNDDLSQKSVTHVDVNHIKLVQFYTNCGDQKHKGVFAIVPIKRTVLHAFEEVDLSGGHSLYHAFKLRSNIGNPINIQCADMHGNLLQGNGHVNVLFKLFRKPAVSDYAKRVRIV